jgi:GDP-L-fucose synthase
MVAKTKIFVAGHNGMVGSAILRALGRSQYQNIITRERHELDLMNQSQVANFFDEVRPDIVYLAAARVGGIFANNTYPADFIYDNLMIQNNVIHHAFKSGCKKLLFLGSSCIYPKLATQPMSEDVLLSGQLEPTNEPYAIAKIAGIKLCESYNRQYGDSHGIDYRSVMPTNLYGPNDRYDDYHAHVIPALILRFHQAKLNNKDSVVVWGSGSPKREFLFVDDLAEAAMHVMNLDVDKYKWLTTTMTSHINVGFGNDIMIKDLALLIKETVGFKGEINFDTTHPDGAPQKLMNSFKLNQLGWKPKVDLKSGLKTTYDYFVKNQYKENGGVESYESI